MIGFFFFTSRLCAHRPRIALVSYNDIRSPKPGSVRFFERWRYAAFHNTFNPRGGHTHKSPHNVVPSDENWRRLVRTQKHFTEIRIFLGRMSSGAGEIAALAARDLPLKKVRFLLCDCDIEAKRFLLRSFGVSEWKEFSDDNERCDDRVIWSM